MSVLPKHYCQYYEDLLRIERLIDAAKDYKYLLNRGYNAVPALNFVSSRYGLSKKERLVIYRSIHSDEIVNNILSKIVKSNELSSNRIVVDGFNVLLTLSAALKCKQLIKGDDTFIRDILGVFGHVDYDFYLFRAAFYLVLSLSMLDVGELVIVFDKNVRWSKFFSSIINKLALNFIPYTMVVLASKSDKKILSLSGIVSSSDVVILMNAKRVFDLAGYIIFHYMKYYNVIDINKILGNVINI